MSTETLLFVSGASQEAWETWAPWPIIGGTGEFLGATCVVDSPADSTYPYGDFVITITRQERDPSDPRAVRWP